MQYILKSVLLITLILSSLSSFNTYSMSLGVEEPSQEFGFRDTADSGVKGEKKCTFSPSTSSCEVCEADEKGILSNCSGSTERSASDCLAYCAPSGAAEDSEPFCTWISSTGSCFAYPGGPGGTIDATTKDAEDCVAHCASVGVE